MGKVMLAIAVLLLLAPAWAVKAGVLLLCDVQNSSGESGQMLIPIDGDWAMTDG